MRAPALIFAALAPPPAPMTDEKPAAHAPTEDASAALASAVEESLRKDKARKFRKGDRVRGRVHKITDSMAFVDLGGKTEGMLDLSEVRRPDGTLEIEEGHPVEAIVIDVAANGVLLKRALIPLNESVEQLKAAQEAGLPVQAKVTAFNKGGLELDLFGLRAFCPASQVEVKKVDDLSAYVGQTMTFLLQEVSSDGKKIVLSRRALLQDDHDKQLAEAKAKVVVGATLRGKVVRVQPFGAFIDLGGVEGLCHVTELTRARIHDASDAVKVGDELEVTVLKVEDTTDKHGKRLERIALSHKSFEKDPWAEVAARFTVGDKVPGRVVRLQPFGAFIELSPGIDGLAHISALSDKRIEHPREAVKEGDAVEAWVLAVEPDKQRISLSLKEPKKAEPRRERPEADRGEKGTVKRFDPSSRQPQAGQPARPARPPRAPRPEGAPADGGAAKGSYKTGQVHDGIVEKVETFGVFVTLPGGGKALVPNSELGVVKNADQKIDFRKFFKAGDTLRVAITETGGRGLKASKVEADRADERSMVREWTQTQAPKTDTGKKGFGTFADLLRKANVVK